MLHTIDQQLHFQKRLLSQYKQELAQLPEGSLIKKKGGFYHQYREQGKMIQKYLPKSDKKITSLKRKRFLRQTIPMMEKNIKVLGSFLESYQEIDPNEIYNGLPKTYRHLPRDCFSDFQTLDLEEWKLEPYAALEKYQHGLKHYTSKGRLVRSKSEALIANLLESYEIPYRYEARTMIGGKVLHPDFILQTSRTIIWEHFGRMDKSDYRQNMTSKIDLYCSAGMKLFDDFIVTFEDEQGTIDTMSIDRIIKLVILDSP